MATPTLRRQETGEALVLLALVEPWPVGHLLIDFSVIGCESAAPLRHAGVHHSARNRGIGSVLIATAERAAAAHGLFTSALEVEKINRTHSDSIDAPGYPIVGERDELWPEADDNGELRSGLPVLGHAQADPDQSAVRRAGAHALAFGGVARVVSPAPATSELLEDCAPCLRHRLGG
jgi:hypothetical protein